MKVNDLEDKIMSVWRTCEDIDTFLYRYLDSPAGEMSEDHISNTLLGVKTLHDQRCQKLWDAFEEVLKSNHVADEDRDPALAAEIIIRNHGTTATAGSARMQFPAHLQADKEPLESEV